MYAGVNAARKELYDTYAEQMLSICFRYTGGMDVAYDLLHDGFLKVFSSCSSFSYRGEGSLKAWMSRIFVNTALEYLRKKDVLKQVVPLDIIAETEEEPPEEIEQIPTSVLMQSSRSYQRDIAPCLTYIHLKNEVIKRLPSFCI